MSPDTFQNIRNRIRQNRVRFRDAALSVAGILLFAGCVHQPFPILILSFGGAAGAAIVIGHSIKSVPFLYAFGIDRINRKIILYALPAFVLGFILGLIIRHWFELPLLPGELTTVALVAPLIGVTEELVFRGYLQGHIRPLGRGLSVGYAAVSHTFYKLLIILSLPGSLQFDYIFLAIWTFIGGLLFGTLRELSGSTIPPLIAHAVFDVILYGGMMTAPVWVWS